MPMLATIELVNWIMGSLFILGVLLIPIGLGFIFIPEKIFQVGEKLNKWISTEKFFNTINKPLYHEKFFYRHHRIFGIFVIFFSLSSIYTMMFYENMSNITDKFNLITDTVFTEWLLGAIYYILIAGNVLAFFIGIVIFVRPSTLKILENKANKWVDIESTLEGLNKRKDLPDTVLPGNPRIFGTLILIGAIIIIVSTKSYFM